MSTFNERAREEGVFLERIPAPAYQEILEVFANQYHFKNGERMRIANYFVGISQDISDAFLQFIGEITTGMLENAYPQISLPEGFQPHPNNVLPTEQKGHFSFASFDMAITEEGLQNIEFQAVPTYPISAAKLNHILLSHLETRDAYIFADHPTTGWKDFVDHYQRIISGDQVEGVVLTDRLIKQQKTNFEFYATQQALPGPIDIVDMEAIYERDGSLYYSRDQQAIRIRRLYNRILLAEALFEDNYPHDAGTWKFRFDQQYDGLTFINHPDKLFEVSKRLSPYVQHPYNPPCFELAAVAEDFQTGALNYADYIWKHKWGGAGHRLILAPDAKTLDSLSNELEAYIAQQKVTFKTFKTDDGQDKIVELRFMTATHEDRMLVVPMARIGHITHTPQGVKKFKIHFGDNNREGYGFAPVVIFK